MKPYILVVEDDAVLRRTVVDILRQEGYPVAEADDGLTAIEQLKRDPPVLMLLDLMMPRMNGWELRQRMLAEPAWAQVPVVVMTAHTSATNDQEYLQAEGWLLKPVRYEHLMRLVAEYCPKGDVTAQ
jgi:CheY-like chemotaxis protein